MSLQACSEVIIVHQAGFTWADCGLFLGAFAVGMVVVLSIASRVW